jgi:streptomycin 6-kinase
MADRSQLVLPNGFAIPGSLFDTFEKWHDPGELSPNWLEDLPGTISFFSEKWQITFDPVIPESNVTLVLLGHSATLGPVVFKSTPIADEFRSEAAALKSASGERVSQLYDLDLDRNAMIVERIVPGTTLEDAHLPDGEATRIAAHLALEMWDKLGETTHLHPLHRWMRSLYRWISRPERIPDDLIDQARQLGEDLLRATTRTCLLHGDLHHTNILRRESGDWAIIDPKGLYGDPAFEVAAWLYNPGGVTERSDLADLTARRLDICSEIWGIDRQHLLRWAFVGCVLSAVWAAEEPGPDDWWQTSLVVANVLREML